MSASEITAFVVLSKTNLIAPASFLSISLREMDAFVTSNVSSMPFNPDMSFESAWDEDHPSGIAEMNTDFIKVEVKPEDQDQKDAEVAEEETNGTCHAHRLHFQVPKVTLMRQTSHDLAIVSDLYSLLEDYRTMARSSKSLLCCQPAAHKTVLTCQLCGDNFVGKADRLLKLFNHFESVHPSDALQLILDISKTHNSLIGHMRKALEFDKWFGEINYSPHKKCFQCCICHKFSHECQIH